MKVKNLLLLAIAVVLSSCSSSAKFKEHTIIGSWQVSHEAQTLENKAPSGGSMLHFYPDSSYTLLKDREIKFGQWSFLNENEIKYGNNVLTISDFDENELKKNLIVSVVDISNNTKSELVLVEKQQYKIADYKEDPFHQSNNQWRLRPNRKESDQEIRARLSNYILHNAYILKSAYEKNATSVSFKNSSGPIKIYKSAIGIVNEDKIKNEWLNCFYDNEDAMKAFNMYSSSLGSRGVAKGTPTGDWVKDDYDVLISLHAQIEKAASDTSLTYATIDEE